jgi:uncharacterized RDD family membrane protein YckC
MIYDLQKAGMWKRISAFLFDNILLLVAIVGIAALLSTMLGYDKHSNTLNAAYEKYETQYGITFNTTQEQYNAMTEAEKANYDAAYEALTADEEAMYAYSMMVNLMLVILSGAILLAMFIFEFAVPMLFGNGQTLGKKIFGIAIMRTDGVKVSGPLMFIRTILGKFTVETMIPVIILFMMFLGTIGIIGPFIFMVLLVLQCIMLVMSKSGRLIHDYLAKTVAVDMSSQMIFDTVEEMLEYKKSVAAEKAAKQDY